LNNTDPENLSDENPPALVIAADTILLSHNTIIEKPSNPRHHLHMLKHLRDMKSHKVFTGVACIAPLEVPIHPGYCLRTTVEETTVYFGSDEIITDDVLKAYVESGEGSDAAGGYKIQEGGGVLIERIQGDYTNVVGLPIHAVPSLPILRILMEVIQID
jgi:septum formation protein